MARVCITLEPIMTLTVRLQPALESALERHCAERGVTKSLVVQEVLAEYLARPGDSHPGSATALSGTAPSASYAAFEALGLIGCVEGVGPADKAGVRAAFDAAKRSAAKGPKASARARPQPRSPSKRSRPR
jgi:hypothetical protein